MKSYFPNGNTINNENIRIVAFAVAYGESTGYTCASGDNGNSIGLYQIDIKYHPEYDKKKLTDPNYNTAAAYKISLSGKDWHQWSSYKYKSNQYKKGLILAKQAGL